MITLKTEQYNILFQALGQWAPSKERLGGERGLVAPLVDHPRFLAIVPIEREPRTAYNITT